MNLWKGSVRNFCVTDCFYAGEQKLLRVAKPDLTDGSPIQLTEVSKKRFSSVFCQFQNFFSASFPVRFYNICAFIRRKTDFRISDACKIFCKTTEGFSRRLTANRMPDNSVESLLFLGNHTGTFRSIAVRLFGYRGNIYSNIQILSGSKNLIQFFQICFL